MANTAFKNKTLSKFPLAVSSASRLTSWPSPLLGSAWKGALTGIDSVPVAYRQVVSQHTGGADQFMVLSSAPSSLSQDYPEPDLKRAISSTRCQLAPGCAHAVRVVAVRSGMTQKWQASPPEWIETGVQGRVEVTIGYRNKDGVPDTDSVMASIQLAPSQEDDGAESAVAGGAWGQLLFGYVPLVRPSDAVDDFFEQVKWAEDTTVTITVDHYGGARVIHCSVVEIPHEHVVFHQDTTTAIHGWPSSIPPLARPQVAADDGADYEEHRFGTSRGFAAASKASQELGPKIASWTAYGEDVAEITDTTPDAITTSSTTFVGLSMGTTITAWSADHPGFDIAGHYAQRSPECLATRLDGAAAIPVRVRVHARFSGAGSNTGVIRFQTTERSWVEIEVDQSTVGTTWTEITTTGWLESSVAVDDPEPVLVDLCKTTGGTLEVRYWDLEFGDQAIAV